MLAANGVFCICICQPRSLGTAVAWTPRCPGIRALAQSSQSPGEWEGSPGLYAPGEKGLSSPRSLTPRLCLPFAVTAGAQHTKKSCFRARRSESDYFQHNCIQPFKRNRQWRLREGERSVWGHPTSWEAKLGPDVGSTDCHARAPPTPPHMPLLPWLWLSRRASSSTGSAARGPAAEPWVPPSLPNIYPPPSSLQK